MSTKKFVTEEERELVRTLFPQMNITKIAEKLGRSRSSINRIVAAENLREKCVQSIALDTAEQDESDGALLRLKELREMLLGSLKEAAPREMAGLAREYRATIETIERMEGDPEDDAALAIDTVAKSIAARMSS